MSKSNKDKEETISISRSDGVTHDLVSVFNNVGISGVVSEVKNARSNENSPIEIDHGNIAITRSDGITHDIIKVFKANSETQGETMKLKPRRSVGNIEVAPALASSIKSKSEYFPKSVRIVHMSDTHNFLTKSLKNTFLPTGDILVHTGDFTNGGTEAEFGQFNDWLGSVSERFHYRVVCIGSRDVKEYGNNWDVMKKKLTNATHVLCHEEVTILGIRFYGSPWHWGHKSNYTIRSGAPNSTSGRFNEIPENIDILLTHGPAYDRLDYTTAAEIKEHWGSRELLEAIRRCKPSVHLHGHVKDSRGVLPAFGNSPLTINSAMTTKDLKVLYACPHVIKATHTLLSSGDVYGIGHAISWSFEIDHLIG